MEVESREDEEEGGEGVKGRAVERVRRENTKAAVEGKIICRTGSRGLGGRRKDKRESRRKGGGKTKGARPACGEEAKRG